MPVHVGELTTEVAMENGETPAPSPPPARGPGWDQRDRARAVEERLERDHGRTAAEGFDA